MIGNKNTAKFVDKYLKSKIKSDIIQNNLLIDVGFVNYANEKADYYIDYLISEDLSKDDSKILKARMLLISFEPEKEDTYKILDEAVKQFEDLVEEFLNTKEVIVDKKQFTLDNFHTGIVKHTEDNINSLQGVLDYFKNSHPYESDLLLEELYEDVNNIIESNTSIENKIEKMCKDLKSMA